MLSWHVAQTKPFSEMIAEVSLTSKGFQAFNPKYYTERITRGQRVLTERCYIPGYIFIRFDPVADQRWPQINFARGIRSLLYSSAESPAPIREKAMNLLLDRCNGDRVKLEDLDAALLRVVPVGSKVRVDEGPFEGFVGKVSWSAQDRLKVVLSMFGRPTVASFANKSVSLVR